MQHSVRLAALAAGAAALVVGLPLQARDINSWQIERSNNGACMMTATFDDASEAGVSLSLVWDKPQEQLGFLAASAHWNRLIEREGDPTALQLSFDGEVTYPQWLYEGARFQTLRNGVEAVMGVWGKEHREGLVEAVTRSNRVSVVIGDTDLGAFDISGADAAYRQLLRCGERG